MKILTKAEIASVLPSIDLMAEIEAGFVAYSGGQSVVPPVGELLLDDPPGEVHIKYGYIAGGDYYVVKVASGFAKNLDLGLSTSNGLMLLFSQQTGELVAALLDEGSLTDIRTAVAGAIAAKHLAPAKVRRIGIMGTGIQARLQLEYLAPVTDCRDVLVWGRNEARIAEFVTDVGRLGFEVASTTDAAEVVDSCNLIVTTTAAADPILAAPVNMQAVHITAVGSDTPHKQELDSAILQAADLVVADSILQCIQRGEIHKALQVNAIDRTGLVELGSVIAGDAAGRTDDSQVTVADLTGVAVQDIQIAKAVYLATDA